MESSKVFYTDFRTSINGESMPAKLKRLARKAGIADIDMDGKFVAIKMHFGELGNISYLRPQLCQGHRGSGQGARGQAFPHRLQHHVSRIQEECPGAS